MDSNMSDLGWKVKDQPWPLKLINLDLWNLFIDTKLNISSENNDSIQKINLSKKKTHLNALGSKFDLDVK